MNILFCSAGRRVELLKDFRKSMDEDDRIIAADLSRLAPALYVADAHYLVPRIDAPDYLDTILDICRRENINAVTTLIDPEIELLAKNRARFEEIGVEVLAPYAETAELCFDKFKMYQYLTAHGVPTPDTWGDYASAMAAVENGSLAFPVFVKPRTGSGSVGARRVQDADTLKALCEADSSLIIQRLMHGDLDADVYIDTISHKAVSAFSKRKLETKIGGASKTISFKDEKLFDFIRRITELLKFNGPVDMDFFYQDGTYYLSEVNPRFGGAYLHAYGAGVDFIKLIKNNLNGMENAPAFGNYENDVVMMMYDSVVITKIGGAE
jgi:carbamoyl-phosphate synthase large subunit